ncbi:MAG TPA: ABC transporter permease [Synergistaceae bacterium]|nr:ABC transporter permease [Synergistaceae bacterium]
MRPEQYRSPTHPLSLWGKTTPVTKICLLILLLLLLAAALAPVIAPFSPMEQKLLFRLRPPMGMERAVEGYIFGTDELGRDILSRCLFALRVSIGLAFIGSLIGAVVGGALGLLSGLGGKWTDSMIMGLVDAQIAIPFTLVAVFIVAVAGSGIPVLVMVLGIAYWEQYARLIRAQTLSVRTSLFVTASQSMGASTSRIAMRHILPNIVSPLVVMFTLNFSNIILLESTLSFLGLGVQPPTASLGSMIGQGRSYMADAWWLVAVPSFFVILVALVILLLGDWLREVLDVRTQ